jgi:hypothetical protein
LAVADGAINFKSFAAAFQKLSIDGDWTIGREACAGQRNLIDVAVADFAGEKRLVLLQLPAGHGAGHQWARSGTVGKKLAVRQRLGG